MNGIYLSQDLSHAVGILEKINKQIDEFEDNDFQITKHINSKRNAAHLIRNLLPFFSQQYFDTKNIQWQNYQFAYIRKGAVLDKSVVELLKKARKLNPSIKIILEIPTYPYLDEFTGLVKLDIWMKEKRWTKKLAGYVDRIVTYSDDKEIFGIPCINISNAYEFNRVPQRQFTKITNEAPLQLIGVATLCFYHGYDRLIEGLKTYYESNEVSKEVQFILVGDGPVLKDYHRLVEEYNLSPFVMLSGKKDLSELDQYYQNADIGIDSLGRHRSGVTYNSSLKGKEYLAKGLPIVSGVKTDLDDRDVPFYYRVPNDDTPIDIAEIVHWYEQLTREKEKQKLSEEIYTYGKSNFTFPVTFSPVINYLKGDLHE